MARENQSRKAVSLTDLRSGGDQNVSEPCNPEECMLFCTSLSQSTTMLNNIGNQLVSWSNYSEDDSGFETSSVMSDFFPRRTGMNGFHNKYKTISERNSQKLKSKIQKRSSVAPYLSRSAIRRRNIQEIRLPPLLAGRGLLKYTRAFQKGNCIYIGKAAAAAAMGLEGGGEYEDLLSVPSSSSSSSDSPSYILTSPPRCGLSISSTRRRHSLYAKVYGHKIPSVAEEDNPRSIVEGLDLDRSASCVEANHQALIPSGSLSVDFYSSQMQNTLNRFNSLCVNDNGVDPGVVVNDDLCNQFKMMMPTTLMDNCFVENQPHSTGHSPFSSPNPWPARQQSAQDLSTPVASDQ